jgi:arylsulfatase A-like enzyme
VSLLLGSLLLSSCTSGAGEPGAAAAARSRGRARNVILISLDTLRADHLGAYGYSLPTSPNFDAFAARSVLFRDCMSASSHTVSSHKAILSGRHAASFLAHFSSSGGPPVPTASPFVYYAQAFRGWISPPLAERLRSLGMRTAGLTDGGYMRPRFGFADGFDRYSSRRIGLGLQRREAERWLEEHGDRPFFLLVHCYDIHCPYDPPRRFLERFEESCTGRLVFKGKCPEGYFNTLDLSEEEERHITRHYDAGILQADHELGELLRYLRRTGRFEDTAIFVTSDHGEALGEHGLFGHGSLHQEQLQVPLAVHVPGLSAGVVEAPVAGVDVAPTILDLLTGDAPEGADGWSLRELLESAGAPGGRDPGHAPRAREAERHPGDGGARRTAREFWSRPRYAANTVNPARQHLTRLRQCAVRDQRGFKLVLDAETGEAELYDLARDPGESENILGRGVPEEGRLRSLLLLHEPGPLEGLESAPGRLVEERAMPREALEELKALGYVD